MVRMPMHEPARPYQFGELLAFHDVAARAVERQAEQSLAPWNRRQRTLQSIRITFDDRPPPGDDDLGRRHGHLIELQRLRCGPR